MVSCDRFTRRSLAVLAASGVLVIASCGGDDDFGLGRRFPVSGSVTYNGKPLEKGQINFLPDDSKGVGATGLIENGSYVMSTVSDKDGARAGKYKVTVVVKEDFEAQAKAAFEKAKAKLPKNAQNTGDSAARVPKEFMVKAAREAKALIPAGYGDVRTTTLDAEVKEQSNTINFNLSDAEAPPEPAETHGGGAKGRRN
jgi:hypothetical protein